MRSMAKMTMNAAWSHDMGSNRHLKLCARMGELEKDAPATFDSKVGEGLAQFMIGLSSSGAKFQEEKPDRTKLRTPSVQQANEGFEVAVVQCTRSFLQAAELTQDPIKKRFVTLMIFVIYGLYIYGFKVHNKTASIELEANYGGEAALTKAIEEYEFHVDGPLHKEVGPKFDVFRMSTVLPPLLFRFGALRSYETWLKKTLQAFQEIGPFTEYISEYEEVFHVNFAAGAPIGVLCGFEDDARRLLVVTGLAEWTDTGMDAFWATLSTGIAHCKSNIFRRTHARMHARTHARTRAHAHASMYTHTHA